jgi:hypothetical protein
MQQVLQRQHVLSLLQKNRLARRFKSLSAISTSAPSGSDQISNSKYDILIEGE